LAAISNSGYRSILITGMAPDEKVTAADEREDFASQLSRALSMPPPRADDWNTAADQTGLDGFGAALPPFILHSGFFRCFHSSAGPCYWDFSMAEREGFEPSMGFLTRQKTLRNQQLTDSQQVMVSR
jgi:hypothetical protein